MPATVPALLADAALAHRLAELAGDERAVQVEFLLHLAEYDRREAPPVPASSAPSAEAQVPTLAAATRPSVRPVAADTWSLRVTVDTAFKEELDRLTELLSHKVPGGELAAVLREAVQCAIEKHGKRRGAVEPARKRTKKAPASPPASPPAPTPPSVERKPVPAEVRRQVWKRDGGCCAWVGPDGHRCGSRWRLEVDHIVAAALGGPSTPENLRLTCAAHNRLGRRAGGRAFVPLAHLWADHAETSRTGGAASQATTAAR